MEERYKKIHNKDLLKKIPINTKMLIIGYGSIGKCFTYVITKCLGFNPENITIIDKLDMEVIENIKFIKQDVDETNYKNIIKTYLKKGDLLVDLAYYISTTHLLVLCNKLGIHFINTSFERFDDIDIPIPIAEDAKLFEKLKEKLEKKGPTAFICIGANPGVIDFLVSEALEKIDLENKKNSEISNENVSDENIHGKIAYENGIRCIHCSEIDTQIEKKKSNKKKWRNSWSIKGLYVEAGMCFGECAFGSYEKKIPENSKILNVKGINMMITDKDGFNTKINSYIPGIKIKGSMIMHYEDYTIPKYLYYKGNYPSMCYAYNFCEAAHESLELLGGDIKEQLILDHSNSDGYDILGALLLSEKKSWWYGSVLGSKETRFLVDGYEHASPTSMQVIAGLISGIIYCYNNPNKGPLSADDLNPIERKLIFEYMEPFLGNLVFKEVDYHPKSLELADMLEH